MPHFLYHSSGTGYLNTWGCKLLWKLVSKTAPCWRCGNLKIEFLSTPFSTFVWVIEYWLFVWVYLSKACFITLVWTGLCKGARFITLLSLSRVSSLITAGSLNNSPPWTTLWPTKSILHFDAKFNILSETT